LKPFEKIEEGI
jgi:major vault protein